jgi:hypothetical protein
LFLLGGPFDPDQKKRIQSHLKECPICRTLASDLTEYFKTMDQVPERVVCRASRRLMDRIADRNRPESFILVPIPASEPGTGRFLLAAEGKSGPRYETIQSYVNVEQDVVARIVRDNESETVTLYWVEGEGAEIGERVLEIEGHPQRFALDAAGQIPLSGFSEADLKKKTIRVLSPLAVFDLEPISGLKEKILSEGRFWVENADFDRIQIEVEEDGGRSLYKISVVKLREGDVPARIDVAVSQRGGHPVFSTAHQGVAVFEELDLEKVLKIRIY